MANDRTARRWQQLRDALAVLAAEPPEQIRWIATAHPDELGLTFDDAYLLVPTLKTDGVGPPDDALALLGAIHQALTAMSGEHNADLWTLQAIRTSRHWQHIRDQARQALAALPPR